MKAIKKTKSSRRQRRQRRVRARIHGTNICPRLNVFRSLRGLYAQLIDDDQGKTLVAVHSKKVDSKLDVEGRKGKQAVAFQIGKELALRALDKKIEKVVFDRAGYKYHGRVKAVAEGARSAGLKF